jgi:hypothetical protein
MRVGDRRHHIESEKCAMHVSIPSFRFGNDPFLMIAYIIMRAYISLISASVIFGYCACGGKSYLTLGAPVSVAAYSLSL